MTLCGRACLPMVKYVGNGTVTLPFKSDSTVESSSGEAADGSAKRSPATMANEKLFFAWSLESFSKMGDRWPSMLPTTTLGENQRDINMNYAETEQMKYPSMQCKLNHR